MKIILIVIGLGLLWFVAALSPAVIIWVHHLPILGKRDDPAADSAWWMVLGILLWLAAVGADIWIFARLIR